MTKPRDDNNRQAPEPAHDILRRRRPSLKAIFEPQSVAVIGATDRPGSVGRTVLWNLLTTSFGGTLYPVNSKRNSVLGIRAYANIGAVPEVVDLAIIVTPALTVPAVIRECVDAGVGGAVIISAGFKELGKPGAELEERILAEARRAQLRLIGPNCLGIMNPIAGLNATFAQSMARPGSVGFISQSGALCTAILDWSHREMIGFSSFISIGSMLDVGWGDLIYYLGDDHRTKSIVIYMESVGDARSFLSAAREVALTKPIIIIKAGRTEAAARAAASHTGALTGSDEVLDAAFRRCGVLRVDRMSDLFYMAEVLSKQPRPQGPRLMILTNAGGAGVLATDALITTGGKLAELSAETLSALDRILPPHWSHNNPIDILGDADPARFGQALDIAVKDANSDGLLAVFAPTGLADPTGVAEKLKEYAHIPGKPILASWMGGTETAAGEAVLNRANIPTFQFPDTAARVFNYMWQYAYNIHGLYETPVASADSHDQVHERGQAASIIDAVRGEGRTLLTEAESKRVLAGYGIPTVPTHVALSEAEAVDAAQGCGFPVAVKLHSKTITHKTDVGGVKLNLNSVDEVRKAYQEIAAAARQHGGDEAFLGVSVQPMISMEGYELILGSSIDTQFGPVLLFGAGGQLVEVVRDRALGLPPLNTTLARRMMEQTRIYRALQGVRGRKPVDLTALSHLMVNFSQLVVEQRWIKELDINPLLVSADRLMALDARIVLHAPDSDEGLLPKPAIRPYPTQYVSKGSLKDGRAVIIRPISPEDEPRMIRFHHTLSERSVYMRYFTVMNLNSRISHDRLTRICFIDYDREMALVVEYEGEIIAVGRLIKSRTEDEAEFALLISDQFQRQGLGNMLLARLVEIGRMENVRKIVGIILPENRAMQTICERLGFRLHHDYDEGAVKAELVL